MIDAISGDWWYVANSSYTMSVFNQPKGLDQVTDMKLRDERT
jgi:hypothetical protein